MNRSLIEYLSLAALALAGALTLAALDVNYPHPSQAAALRLNVIIPVLGLGAFGAWLWGRFRADPDWPSRALTLRRYVWIVAEGAGFALVVIGLDVTFGISAHAARVLGVASIHVDFPYSILTYTTGAVIVESLYRIILIPILFGLIARLLLRRRADGPVFWTLAVATSLIEPLSQAALFAHSPIGVAGMATVIFLFNLSEARHLRLHGVAAPILMRIVFYGVWHVTLGPAILG